ncbi:hypothetical protein B7463_g11268, partial [Scytalidium lignicola]
MSDNYEQRERELAVTLATLKAKFHDLQTIHSSKQLDAQKELSDKTGKAMSVLSSLTILLDGEFKPSKLPPTLPSVLEDLTSTWSKAKAVAEQCFDIVSSHSVDVVQLHDAGLATWNVKANNLRVELNQKLQSTREALNTEQSTLDQLYQQRQASLRALEILRDKLREQQHKYDEADKWTWIWLPARLWLEILKPIIEAITNDIEGAENAIRTAERLVVDAEQRVADQKLRVQSMSNLAVRQADSLHDGENMLRMCISLQSEVEVTQHEVARLKNERLAAWDLVSRCFNRAEEADYALTKAAYATVVLQVVEVAMEDHTLLPAVKNVVQHLADHDDEKGSVHSIEADGHPEGLLALVQRKLEQAGTQALVAVTPAVAHYNLLRSVASALAAPAILVSGVDLSAEDKKNVISMLHRPLIAA